MSGRGAGDRTRTALGESLAGAVGRIDRGRLATLFLAAVGACVAVVVASEVFPYRSLNHDEGVYLQQADLLLHGRLFLRPPVDDALRPWFFVESPRGLYSKYAPVTAAVFALGEALGGYTIGLAAIAAALVGGVVALGRELFDARVGALAGVLVLSTPLFVVHSGVFLPYALTTALNVAFAVAYLRAERRKSRRDAAAAGAAVAVAFFTRPYTAVLFALPFVAHAVATLIRARAWRAIGVVDDPGAADDARALLARRVVTAALGSVGVVVTFGYNAAVTGDPFVFPYLAFAPRDGVGFGRRAILGHTVEYTPELAVRANARVLADLFTEWVVAGPVGTVAAGIGVAVTLCRGSWQRRVRRGLLAATFVTVAGGNLAFWGNYNILGALDVSSDGLIHYLGPYYHYDLVVPTAVFAAAAAVGGIDRLRTAVAAWSDGRDGVGGGRVRAVVAVAVLVCAAVAGGVGASAVGESVEPNVEVTAEYRAGYAPLTDGGPPSESVVFLPTPYGPWLNHPFQTLRNDADYDGRVYALGDTHELAVAATFPDRDLYRYVHAGSWTPTDGSPVRAAVVPVERVSGDRISLDATLRRPEAVRSTTVRVTSERGSTYLVANGSDGPLPLSVTVTGDRVTVSGPTLAPSGDGSVPLDDTDEVTVEVFVATGQTRGFSYEMAFPVERSDGTLRALSPTVERCPVPTRCVPRGVAEPSPNRGVDVTFSNATAGR